MAQQTLDKKPERVGQMFDRIAPTYDRLNHTLSLGIDRRWRRAAVDALAKFHPEQILDVATGTGDFAMLLAKRLKPRHVTGADISEGMMAVGQEKAKKARLEDIISFQHEDCLKLSFPDGSFDAVTSAYGVRNFQDLEAGLGEMLRVLRPGGHLLIVELTPPPRFPMKQLFHVYAHVVMPFIGRLVSHDDSAYTYLPASMEAFPQAEELESILRRVGFADVQWRRFTFGISTMYIATAPEQRPSLKEGTGKKLYGLIGHPLGHSFSRGFFTEKFARENIDAEYLNFDIPDAAMLHDVIHDNPELRGLNVTLPHKQAVIPLLNELSDEAREIGAVNVIRIERFNDLRFNDCSPQFLKSSIHLKGFNSDIIGFMGSIKPLLKPWHKKALVLGTGGASKAICVGLTRLGIEWTYVSRKAQPSMADGQWSMAGGQWSMFNYSDLTADVMQDYTVVVNCTPVGMFPKVDAAPAIPYEHLTPQHLLFDCVYNPEDTLFMQKGRAQGAVVKNGLEMLHLQAVASWEFWNE